MISNGKFSAPIRLKEDLSNFFGLSANLGYIIQNASINQWSERKPVFYKTDKNLNTVKGAVAGDSGFSPQWAGSDNLTYKKRQTGDEDLPFRMGDFDGYNHYEENPFDIEDISYIGLGQASTGTYTYVATIPIRGIIKTLLNEGQFGILGKWTDVNDQSQTGQTDYYYYNDIKDKNSIDVTIKIDWNPDDHEDFYIRDYKFYLATPAWRTFTVDGWAISAQFGTILSAPTKNVEWANFDESFSLYNSRVVPYPNGSGFTIVNVEYNTTDELPTEAYFNNFINNETVKVEYKTGATDKDWKLYYYGRATYTGQTSSGAIYQSSFRRVASPPAIYAVFYNGDIDARGANNWYFKITRNPDTN